mgnify:CR=1 FL=1
MFLKPDYFINYNKNNELKLKTIFCVKNHIEKIQMSNVRILNLRSVIKTLECSGTELEKHIFLFAFRPLTTVLLYIWKQLTPTYINQVADKNFKNHFVE